MRLYLLGQGIQRSRSPGTWNRVFDQLGLDWRYGLLDTDQDGLPEALNRLKDPDVLGYNVTMPYKGWAYARGRRRRQPPPGQRWMRRGQLAHILGVVGHARR